jgi:zinc transport system substrate-binding protein
LIIILDRLPDMRTRGKVLVALAALALLAGACQGSGADAGKVSVVASFYPLAWIAERIGGDLVAVEDFTPPGVEAHDVALSAGQRADVESADVVLLLGDFGFQPEIEKAAQDASGLVVKVADQLQLVPSEREDLTVDPHVWLDPVLMETISTEVEGALAQVDPENASAYGSGESRTMQMLRSLDSAYRTGLNGCEYSTFVTTHEAFGYLAREYGLEQLGVEGLTPESEPSAARIQAAIDAIDAGDAAPAVFYERTDEGKRVGESVASDAGVPAMPLDTLEFDPSPEDYVSAMRTNLVTLQEGLRCAA